MQRVALITGVSSGIGQAAALFAERGFRVFGTFRTRRPANLSEAVTLHQMDVCDDSSVHQTVSAVITAADRVDVLVNNAGYALVGALEETSLAEARDQFETNFFGAWRVTQEILPTLRRQGCGRIINISSVLGLIPGPFMGAYTASKHAVEGYTETLDHEIRRFGVRAILVEPSFTNTSILENERATAARLDTYAGDRAAVERAWDREVKNGSAPKEVAETVYLAATAITPTMRYPVGRAKRVGLLRRLVPPAIFAQSLRKQFGLSTEAL